MSNIIHIQPALPSYRVDFFERLNRRFGAGIKVYHGPGTLGALTKPVNSEWSIITGPIRLLPFGLSWQPDVITIPIHCDDIVVLSGNPRQLSTLVLLVRAKLAGTHVIWWGHYWSSTSRRWRQVLRFLPMALADALLFYTDDEIAAFQNDPAGLRKNRPISSLNNGINIDPILEFREPYVPNDRENALIFIGRLTTKANLSLLFEALAHLGSDAPKLYIIGEGQLSTELRNLSVELNIAKNIQWCGALTTESGIASIANRCKAFVYPGEVGLSLIHAMAYGLPAIVHNQPHLHMPEIAAFKEGKTGITFPHNDSYLLSKAIYHALYQEVALQSFSDCSIDTVDNSFNTKSMADRFLELVNKIHNKNTI